MPHIFCLCAYLCSCYSHHLGIWRKCINIRSGEESREFMGRRMKRVSTRTLETRWQRKCETAWALHCACSGLVPFSSPYGKTCPGKFTSWRSRDSFLILFSEVWEKVSGMEINKPCVGHRPANAICFSLGRHSNLIGICHPSPHLPAPRSKLRAYAPRNRIPGIYLILIILQSSWVGRKEWETLGVIPVYDYAFRV